MNKLIENKLRRMVQKELKSILKEETVKDIVQQIGPYIFHDDMEKDVLLTIYASAIAGYSNYNKGFYHKKSEYKTAYMKAEKLLKDDFKVKDSELRNAVINYAKQ